MINHLNRLQGSSDYSARDLLVLTWILILALLVRVLFFSGAMGSDDVTYAMKAMDIAAGNWDLSGYVGSQRYGLHLPMAVFMSLFGYGEFAANSFQLTSSLVEIAVLWWIAYRFFGRRVAMYSALVLAVLPLHVNIAGRIFADPPMNLFITLVFACFIVAEQTRRVGWYVAAGICAGLVFWTKSSVAILIAPVLLIYAVYIRRFRSEWLWLVGSAAGVSLGYVALLAFLSGDPLFILNSRTQAIGSSLSSSSWNFGALAYFRYLFVDVKYTGLLGPLALIGGILLIRNKYDNERQVNFLFVLWGAGLLAILSFGVISIDPLLFVPKQSNYMTIFAAPLCLFAAITIDQLQRVPGAVLLTALIGIGFLLSAFAQQDIRVFVSNSVAADQYAAEHPDKVIYGTRPATYLSRYWARARNDNDPNSVGRISPIPDDRPLTFPPDHLNSTASVYLLLDTQTMRWSRAVDLSITEIAGCWRLVTTLEPTGFGPGRAVVTAIRSIAGIGPEIVASKVNRVTNSIYASKPAYIYEIPPGCTIELN